MQFACIALSVCLLVRQDVPPKASFEELAQRASGAMDQNPKEAAELCRRALALNPSWAEGWFDLGASLYELGQYRDSKKAFEQAALLTPNKGAVWGFLGLVDYQLNEYDAAVAHIQ